jgi:GNAT superfamily N-acetyltransferase
MIRWSDLQVGLYIAFVVDAHDVDANCPVFQRSYWVSDHGVDLQAMSGFALAMTLEIKHLGPGDVDWLVAEHARLYARDEGFDASFATLVREILEDFDATHDPTCERGFIAWDGAQRLGSIFCMRADDTTAKLRLFLLTPDARGRWEGRRLLSDCMNFARNCGYVRMELWTHESHRAACALYEKTGWRLVRTDPKRRFGVDVVEQGWEVDLS